MIASVYTQISKELGWISCTWAFSGSALYDVSAPDDSRKITEEQKETLWNMFVLRGKDTSDYFTLVGEAP